MIFKTKEKLEQLIQNGYDTFWTGMALGFDLICAEILIKLKSKYPKIKIYGALPCKNQDKYWTVSQKIRYRNLLKHLDYIHCIHESYTGADCMIERNEFMIKNSSIVLALFNGNSGGTARTLEYAKKQGLTIEIINP